MNRLTITSTCRSCGEALQGRRDKLYCDDHCRVRHHRKTATHPVLRRVDRALMHNRVLLRRVRDLGGIREQADATFSWLRRQGFDFNYHTHVELLADGRTAVMCYEEGYVLETSGVLALTPVKPMRLRGS